MFCTNCGNNIPDGSLNCPVCGAAMQQPQQPQYQQPVYQQPTYQQPYQQPVAPDNSGSVLTFGILSMVFSEVPVLGLIFAIIGLSKSGAFARAHGGACFGKAKVGRILSIIALIISIIANVLYLIVILGGGCAACIDSMSSSSYYSYYY